MTNINVTSGGDKRREKLTNLVATHIKETLLTLSEATQIPAGRLVSFGIVLLRDRFEEAIGKNLATLAPEDCRMELHKVLDNVLGEIRSIMGTQSNFSEEGT